MARILGLDLGTNSLGWAVVEKEDGKYSLVDKGVRIFQEGVKIEKGIESSKSADRTDHRSARRIKYRRKLRKIETLKVLSKYGYCPMLSDKELDLWRYKRIYPSNEKFRNWWLTNDNEDKNPYFFRHLAITQKLNLKSDADKQKLGRAFYHIAQRRGFLSNRLDSTPENETGTVKISIKELQEKKGSRTLGQYFYEDCYLKGEKIRDQYTHREDDYLDEFNRICEFQGIPDDVKAELYKAIFYQRPLKSQKGLIGKCVFEKNKARCAVSRPEFEEYRMLCFINNIKIKTPDDEKLRFLNQQERIKILPQFFRKSEKYKHFNFEDLAKQIAPKKQYKFYKDKNKNPEDYLFNYSMNTTVSGCPVSARFKELFGDSFIDETFNYAKDIDSKTPKQISDAWHVLNTFDSASKLKEYADKHLNFDDDKKVIFSEKINLKQDFASLSLKAINKILPYLREGLIYSHAVFLANMEETVPESIWKDESNKQLIRNAIREIIEDHSDNTKLINVVNGVITNARRKNETWSKEAKPFILEDLNQKTKNTFGAKRFEQFPKEKQEKILLKANKLAEKYMPKQLGKGEHIKTERIDEAVVTFLKDNFGNDCINSDKLYHPSDIETYKPAKRGVDGRLYLGSPMTSSVRNPMAMRALHQLRIVINELIKEGIIDQFTKINIEMSRGLLNANERSGLKSWQNSREKARKEYIEKIKEFFSPEYEPSEDEILKYQLWEEQEHICLYTGKTISLEDFLGANPKFDIEHTIPRSQSYDNSQENKTLCDNNFNRAIKKNSIPFDLSNHSEILTRIEHWEKTVDKLDKEIEKSVWQSKSASEKTQKDRAIQKRHQLTYERNYWRNKHKRFTMKEVPEGFKNSQMVDIGIITKYSRLYLKTIFQKVYTVKGSTVADFRKMWGLQDNYSKKARVNHVHHCIDAITIACMDKSNYETLAKFYHGWEELHKAGVDQLPKVNKPWKTFTEDVKTVEDEILVSHYTPDNLPKQSKRKLRKRGKIQYNEQGKPIYEQGDTVRGSLHKDTFYGAIEREVPNKKTGEIEKQIKHVKRISLSDIKKGDIDKIVDESVKEKVRTAIRDKSLIISNSDTSKNKINSPIWMNIDKGVEIKKVRIYQNPKGVLTIKKQKDISKNDYKRNYLVETDDNYAIGIYDTIMKGKSKKTFKAFNNYSASEYYQSGNNKILKSQDITPHKAMFPDKFINEKGFEFTLKSILKIGTLVIICHENDNKDEILGGLISNRLYRVFGFRGDDGRIKLRFHKEARPDKEQETPSSNINIENPPAKLLLSLSKFHALIEGIDFRISPLGKIEAI